MMESNNVVVLRGRLTSDPVVRDLPSGSTVTQLDLTTPHAGGSVSVPVVVHDRTVDLRRDDEVVVTGHVARRFFRAGGVTQSRTEVIAAHVVRSTHRKTAERLIAAALSTLDPDNV